MDEMKTALGPPGGHYPFLAGLRCIVKRIKDLGAGTHKGEAYFSHPYDVYFLT
jgi:hypothetical protein